MILDPGESELLSGCSSASKHLSVSVLPGSYVPQLKVLYDTVRRPFNIFSLGEMYVSLGQYVEITHLQLIACWCCTPWNLNPQICRQEFRHLLLIHLILECTVRRAIIRKAFGKSVNKVNDQCSRPNFYQNREFHLCVIRTYTLLYALITTRCPIAATDKMQRKE